MTATTTPTTKQNLIKFVEMACNARTEEHREEYFADIHRPIEVFHELERKYNEDTLAIWRMGFMFATRNYEIGEPVDESRDGRRCITAGMSCSGMGGIIMYRDKEVTAHT